METKTYWFKAKTYGWGWGLPLVWQGWLVYAVAVVLLGVAAFIFPADNQPIAFSISTGVVILLLLIICWLKGEPPRWRWGK